MSRTASPEIAFSHSNDCEQSGCRGHKLRLVFCASSDTIAVEIDGHTEHVFCDHTFHALMEAYQRRAGGK